MKSCSTCYFQSGNPQRFQKKRGFQSEKAIFSVLHVQFPNINWNPMLNDMFFLQAARFNGIKLVFQPPAWSVYLQWIYPPEKKKKTISPTCSLDLRKYMLWLDKFQWHWIHDHPKKYGYAIKILIMAASPFHEISAHIPITIPLNHLPVISL